MEIINTKLGTEIISSRSKNVLSRRNTQGASRLLAMLFLDLEESYIGAYYIIIC